MSDEPREPDAPAELGDLDREIAPPPALEDRVVTALEKRGLLTASATSPLRVRLAAAALLLLTAGFFVGHWSGRQSLAAPPDLGAQEAPSRYALLLYEDAGYRAVSGREEEVTRYHEYSRWVAWASQRKQFVAGEDLAVEAGRRLTPGVSTVSNDSTAPAGARLSGMFVVEAKTFDQAVELARRLPHLEHGGHVVVQRVIPTEDPPGTGERG